MLVFNHYLFVLDSDLIRSDRFVLFVFSSIGVKCASGTPITEAVEGLYGEFVFHGGLSRRFVTVTVRQTGASGSHIKRRFLLGRQSPRAVGG